MKNDKLVSKDKGFIDDAVAVVINLIHAQFHAEVSYFSTNDEKWLKLADECRKDRTKLLDLMVIEDDSESWCFAKHTLFCVGGYIELGSRCLSVGKNDLAKKYYQKASKWLETFYIINKLK